MKINRLVKAALLAVVGLTLASVSGRAAQDVPLGPSGTDDPVGASGSGNQLNVQMGVSSWQNWFVNQTTDTPPGGVSSYTLQFDTSNAPPSGDLFGSVRQSQTWDGVNGGNVSTFVCIDGGFWGGATVDLTAYKSVDFDFKYDTNSNILPTNSAQVNIMVDGGPRNFSTGLGLTNIADSGSTAVDFDGNWHHLSIPIPVSLNVTASKGPGFQIFNGATTVGTFTYWVANLTLIANPVAIAAPLISSKLQPAITGLNAIATIPGSSGQFNRYQVVTVGDGGYTFVGQPSVTYSWKIKSFPTATGQNFQQHLFLFNGPNANNSAPDFAFADCIFMTVQQSDAGVATFNFRYKTNQPAGNGMLFNTVAPTLSNSLPTFTTNTTSGVVTTNAARNPNFWPIQPVANLNDPSGAVGNWSITFANSTNVTITSPTGLTTNFVFDLASSQLFADPMSVAVGGQPNNPNGAGKSVVLGNFSITGSGTPLSDNFETDATLDTNTWVNLSGDKNGLVLVPPGADFWISWSLPDSGFALQTVTNLPANSNWVSVTPITSIIDNGSHQALIASNGLSSSRQFFSLVKRSFTQLQVLLPGEVNAPGTASGKITNNPPFTTDTSTIFNVTVNAVDSKFNIIPGITDTIGITSSDTTSALPGSANLVNGTASFQFEFGTGGGVTNTITATDLNPVRTNVPPGVSAPVIVN